jgi:ABC-2 type transport system permease protein
MGLIAQMLINAGVLSKELSKGTLILPLSKGLSRGAVIISKFIVSAAAWTVSYVAAVLTGCVYTKYLFGHFGGPRLFFSLFCLWLFGVFLLAVLLLSSTIAPGSYGGLILTAGALGAMFIIDIFPKLQKWNPISLASENSAILTSAKTAEEVTAAVWVTAILTALCVVLSLALFRKKKL